MKYLIKTTLLLLALLLPTLTHAHDFEVNSIYYNKINSNKAEVTYKGGYSSQYSNEYSGSVNIPATVTYNGTTYSVTSIGTWAFCDCSSLTYINIPNSVTSIGEGAFTGCSSLTRIIIPSSVTEIGNHAFYRCSNLTTINIPNSVTVIGNSAFSSCTSLTSINIPSSVSCISGYAFENCSSLTNINIPNSVTTISYGAFFDCSSLANINIPNSVTYIGRDSFWGCSSLSAFNIPNSVTYIGFNAFEGTAWYNNQPDGLVYAGSFAYKYKGTMSEGTNITLKDGTKGIAGLAFYNCSNLTTINIPNSVTYIDCYAFSGCSSMTNINIPNSVTTIGYSAFSSCPGLTTINIPNSVTYIDCYAFSDCSSLKTVYIGSSVTHIDELAFTGDTPLSNIFCYATIPPECIYNNYTTFSDYSATLHVPAASLAAYFTAPVWSNFENIVGDAIEPTGISISRDSVDILSGEQIVLIATVTPANASCKEVAWYSTDTSIATVDNGVVTAISIGECDIYAYCMGIPAICHVSVSNRISLGQQEAMLLPNHMLTLTPTAPAMPSGFTVTSSDPMVAAARVMNGKVQIVGIKEGTTTITVASTDDTAQPATCIVTVYTESGDANCDGFVNISDVTLLIDYLLGNEATTFKEANADFNADSSIDIADVTTLIDHLLSTSE